MISILVYYALLKHYMFEPLQKQQLPHILRYPSLTMARWLCARPLPSRLTGPGAASAQYIPCAAPKADPVIVVPATAGKVSISWYGKQTACDNYSRRRIINKIERHCTFSFIHSSTWMFLQILEVIPTYIYM